MIYRLVTGIAGVWEANTHSVDADELLHEHEADSNDGALPAPVAEAVDPRCDF